MTNITNLLFPVFVGNLQQVQQLVESGNYDVNTQTVGGNTPLHFASLEGHLPIVKYLVEQAGTKGAMAKNHEGNTPLHLSSFGGHSSVVKYLLEHCGADVDSQNNAGKTPLDLACEQNETEVVEILMEHLSQKTVYVDRRMSI